MDGTTANRFIFSLLIELAAIFPMGRRAVAELIVPDWGYKVDSRIELSYRPAWLHRLAGGYDMQP
jgi:hypothetical protein